jgi:CBS domain-containing protein
MAAGPPVTHAGLDIDEEAETMRVKEIMQPDVCQTFAEECLADAAGHMRDHGVGSLAVMDGDRLIGIVTERDLLGAMADGAPPQATAVRAYMSAAPLVVSPDTDVIAACRLMTRHDLRHLPVVEAGELRGIVSARDLLAVEAWSGELLAAR